MKVISPNHPGEEGGVAVLLRKILDLEVRTVVVDPAGRLVFLRTTYNSDKFFKLVAVYVPCGAGQSGYFRSLENFLGTSHTLVLLVDLRLDFAGSNPNSRRNPCLSYLLSRFQLVDLDLERITMGRPVLFKTELLLELKIT